MSLRSVDVDRGWAKLGMVIKDTNDRHALLFHDGKFILRTKRSFGSGKIEGRVQFYIRQQMKLSESEFDDLIACPLDLPKYIEILRRKGMLQQ